MKAVKRRHLYLSPLILLPTPSSRGKGGRWVYPLSIPYLGKAKSCPPLTTNIVPTQTKTLSKKNKSFKKAMINFVSHNLSMLESPSQIVKEKTNHHMKGLYNTSSSLSSIRNHNRWWCPLIRGWGSPYQSGVPFAIPQESCKLLKHNKIDKEVVVYG